ncbi:Septal ring factor EnvC, activator of murein hydrolases AmiA and AmiB [Thermosyntropha lipolytica DSM 11003]|uniref:Septal ring factor EnvC, activator of murein hydrolases AmiA and AmiB n=1 Tax=Thermosyntropha lipolytica DSM 11003 TaxID=1123382 RepID=A0A1M5KLU0_9FIRM|nr:M23 family metallopeptidase [Thermosyntropha lipolytica]SHG53711.1 Septal ring factor EnvC, activator of murein hydrolases AmiA and AmiB [Thermosyntropha lipolytica DSM 11003]
MFGLRGEKRKPGYLALFLACCLLLGAIFPVYADELEEKKRELNEVSRQIKANQQMLKNKKKEANSVWGQIKGIESDILNTEKKINQLDDRIGLLEENIAIKEKEIEETEAKLNAKVDILRERLVFIYETGDVSYLEVLFSATDIKDFITRYDMLSMIVEQDRQLIEEIEAERDKLKMQKSDLEVKKKELVNIKEEQAAQKEALEAKKQEKAQLFNQLQMEAKEYEKALNELEELSRQLESVIRQLQSKNSGPALGTGVYTWPTPGYYTITSPFGMRFHPILQVRKLHTGVDIGAPMGADIVAADSGIVIYAGYNGGYGNMIIIDHGNGMSTLYAHMSRFVAVNGQKVTKGEVIGKVGSTGFSTGPHLHFEVRKDGSPVDPMGYIR